VDKTPLNSLEALNCGNIQGRIQRMYCGYFLYLAFAKAKVALNMKCITDKEAQVDLPTIMRQTALSHEPVRINGPETSSVLIAEEDWRAIEETVYLLSIPGMRASIREGMDAPRDEFSTELPW